MVLTRPCRLGPPGGPVIPLPGIIHGHQRGRARKGREKLARAVPKDHLEGSYQAREEESRGSIGVHQR